MAEKIHFHAQPRQIIGKKSKVFRNQRQVPANISGNLDKPISVVINEPDFAHLYERVGDTGLFYITVEGEKADRPVLISEVQFNPLTHQTLHVVFRQVDLSEKVSAEVPVETIGEFDMKDALVVMVHSSIEVEALPQDLPEKFIIDVAKFTEVGQTITFNQLDYDREKVTLKIEEDQFDTPVVMVQAVKEEVEPEPVAAVEGAVPVEGEAAAPADGAEAPKATEAKDEKKE